MNDYYTLLTKYGLNKIVYARSQNLPIKLSKIVVGDGEIVPSEEMTSLKSPKHTININEIRQDEKNKNYLILTGVIPTDIGGFYINEIGVLDDSNKLFAIGNMAKTYKPLLSEGSAKEVIIEIIIEVANASEVVINIDNSIVLATREWVKNEIKNIYVKLTNYYTKAESDARFELKGSGYTKAETNALLDKKQNLTSTYTKSESDARFELKGAGYTKAEIDSKFKSSSSPDGVVTKRELAKTAEILLSPFRKKRYQNKHAINGFIFEEKLPYTIKTDFKEIVKINNVNLHNVTYRQAKYEVNGTDIIIISPSYWYRSQEGESTHRYKGEYFCLDVIGY